MLTVGVFLYPAANRRIYTVALCYGIMYVIYIRMRNFIYHSVGFLQENATANIVIIIEEYNINNVFSPISAFLFSKTKKECRFFTNFGTSKEIEWRAKHNMFRMQRILDNYNAAKDLIG